MMFDLPSAPFTMSLCPPRAKAKPGLLEMMKEYSAAKYAKTRAEVEAEIKERWKKVEKVEEDKVEVATEKPKSDPKESFLSSWKKKKSEVAEKNMEIAKIAPSSAVEPAGVAGRMGVGGDTSVDVRTYGEQNNSVRQQNDSQEVVFKVR